ncbi:uncharacterized protein YpbB [Salirhabdus euzebyi]|uniref:Uncharacterized protein YpbB n=1 Tax=Salirhabdus euzebyi TaxID=394506 RepID=A0A841PYQ0_9BACI|nr:helix-turn-helix domain-containing protein [Salirhabdus euzebyi]MBB6452171.1 uncharacterized protein YpbB [Salirhabdus euzebyi]
MFHTILLDSFQKIQMERSDSAIFHLLTGKKSSQTVQDANTLNLKNYFGIYKTLKRKDFDKEILYLMKLGFIKSNPHNTTFITNKGITFLQHHMENNKGLHWLSGYHLHQMAPVFWSRIQLFIQTASNVTRGNNRFVPIVDQELTIQWMKQFFVQYKGQLDVIFNDMYEELCNLLSKQPSQQASIFVSQLTGFNKIGLSKFQTADRFQMTKHDVEMYTQSTLHFMMNQIYEKKGQYKRLLDFIPNDFHKLPLTESAKQTLRFLNSGIPLNTIAKKRRLKLNTVLDHVIEIAFVDPRFPIRKYVSEEVEQQILEVTEKLDTKRLKTIKEHLPEHVDYFAIRLVHAIHFRSSNPTKELPTI